MADTPSSAGNAVRARRTRRSPAALRLESRNAPDNTSESAPARAIRRAPRAPRPASTTETFSQPLESQANSTRNPLKQHPRRSLAANNVLSPASASPLNSPPYHTQ